VTKPNPEQAEPKSFPLPNIEITYMKLVGMLEYWNTGIMGLDGAITILCQKYKSTISFVKPIFHHSTIPLFQL